MNVQLILNASTGELEIVRTLPTTILPLTPEGGKEMNDTIPWRERDIPEYARGWLSKVSETLTARTAEVARRDFERKFGSDPRRNPFDSHVIMRELFGRIVR